MSVQKSRPRSTRTAIVALIATVIGVAIAGFNLFGLSTKQQSGRDRSSSQSHASASLSVSEVSAGRDVNINNSVIEAPKENQPVHTIVINESDYQGVFNLEDFKDDPRANWTVCFGANLAFSNNTNHDIPLQISEYETDNEYDLAVVKSRTTEYFVAPKDPGKFLILNSENGGLYFIFDSAEKCQG